MGVCNLLWISWNYIWSDRWGILEKHSTMNRDGWSWKQQNKTMNCKLLQCCLITRPIILDSPIHGMWAIGCVWLIQCMMYALFPVPCTICHTVYPKKYAHGFVVLCFVVVMQSFIMNSHEVFIHIHQGCFAGTGAIVRLPQCQWSKPDGYGKISQCITTTKHSKAKTVCIFLGIYCIMFHGNMIYWYPTSWTIYQMLGEISILPSNLKSDHCKLMYILWQHYQQKSTWYMKWCYNCTLLYQK